MGPISSSAATKAWSYFLKIAPFLKKALKNNYTVFKIAKQSGAATLENNETSIYFHTVDELSQKWHPDIERLFVKKSIKSTVLKSLSLEAGAVDDIVLDIEATLHADRRFHFIQSAETNWKQIAREFLEAYEKNTEKTATPVDKLQLQRLKLVGSQVNVPEKSLDLSGLIKDYSELRKTNKHRTVIELLSKLRNENWPQLSKEQQYNVLLNLAITYHELKEDVLAAQHFLELLAFHTRLGETFGYVALAYAMLNDFPEALLYADKAIAEDPTNINAYLAKILARTPMASSDEIKQIVPKALQSNPIIEVNIALSLDREGRHDEAIDIFEKVAEHHPAMDIFRSELLNSLGASHIQSLGFHKFAPPYNLKDDDRTLINDVRKMFASAWDFYKNTDLQNSRVYILTNLGTTNSLLGENQEAISDITTAFKLAPAFSILLNLWVLYKNDLKNRKWVTQQADQLNLSEAQKLLILQMKTEVAYDDGLFNSLLDEAITLHGKTENPQIRKETQILIIEYYFQLDKNNEAVSLVDKLIEEWPGDKMGYFYKAKLANAVNDPKEVRRWIELALAAEPIDVSDPFLERAMQILHKIGQYDLVITTLKDFPIDRYVPSLNYLLLSQLDSGNHAEAAKLAQHWHRLYPTNPRFVEILGSIQLENGQYGAAISTFKSFLKTNPGDRVITVKLGTAYYKALEFSEAVKIFNKISGYDDFPVSVGFQAADAYCKSGEFQNGYELAYEIRRKNYRKIKAHEEYIRVLTMAPLVNQTPIKLDKVTKDTAVTIADTLHDLQTLVIVENPILKDEISPEEVISKQLLDKEVGDIISVPSQRFTVTNILSKFTHAYQDSIKQLGSRFGNQGGIKVGNFAEDANVVSVVKELISLTSEAPEEANESAPPIPSISLPLCVQAARSGQTAVALWYNLTSPEGNGIDSQMFGESFESFMLQVGSKEMPVLFDVTSLLALNRINALEVVANSDQPIWVTESTVHLIKAELIALKKLPKNIPTIAEIEAPPSNLPNFEIAKEARIKELEQLMKWIEAHSTLIQSRLASNFDDDAQIINTIGRSYFDIRQISTNDKILLITDDRNFRTWCSQEGAKTVPTVAFLQGLQKRSNLSELQLKEYCKSLLNIHYLLVPVDGQTLIDLLIETKFSVTFPFSHATLWIAGPFSNVEEASTIVVDFLNKLYQEITLLESRKAAVQFVLKRFVGGRTFGQVANSLLPKLRTRFLLMPNQLQEIMQFLAAMR